MQLSRTAVFLYPEISSWRCLLRFLMSDSNDILVITFQLCFYLRHFMSVIAKLVLLHQIIIAGQTDEYSPRTIYHIFILFFGRSLMQSL